VGKNGNNMYTEWVNGSGHKIGTVLEVRKLKGVHKAI
jgi:hypothetical protein